MTSICPEKANISIILLAAGASSRMKNRDKLLETIGEKPLLRRVSEMCCGSRASEVIVVLREPDITREAALEGLPITVTRNPNRRLGMASSIAAGLAQIDTNSSGFMIVLADMPNVVTSNLDALITAFAGSDPSAIFRAATKTGVPGHPVLFGAAHCHALQNLAGDEGAQRYLQRRGSLISYVNTLDESALVDLDTPEDWAKYRANSE